MTETTIRHLQARCLRNAAHLAGDRQDRRQYREQAAQIEAGQGVLGTPTTDQGGRPWQLSRSSASR